MALRRSKTIVNNYGSMLFNLRDVDCVPQLTINVYVQARGKNTHLCSADWKKLQLDRLGCEMGDTELFRLVDHLDFMYADDSVYLYNVVTGDRYLVV